MLIVITIIIALQQQHQHEQSWTAHFCNKRCSGCWAVVCEWCQEAIMNRNSICNDDVAIPTLFLLSVASSSSGEPLHYICRPCVGAPAVIQTLGWWDRESWHKTYIIAPFFFFLSFSSRLSPAEVWTKRKEIFLGMYPVSWLHFLKCSPSLPV